MGLAGRYLIEIGHRTALEMKFGLAKMLLQRYKAEFDEDVASYLAAAVTNRVFTESPDEPGAQKFVRDNAALVENEAERVRGDSELCDLLTSATYSACYARYIETGGKRGIFSNNFLAYVRAVSKSFVDFSYIDISANLATALPRSVVESFLTLLKLGIFRPLPRNPDSKEIYRRVHDFAVTQGVAFK